MTEHQGVSVIGLGLMGSAIARELVGAGHDVTVWNRTASKAEALVDAGATASDNLAQAIASSPVSIWCLLDYQVMAELMDEPATRAALAGTTVIPTATGGPDDVALVASVLRSAGATLLDAKIMFFPAGVGADGAELLLSGDHGAFSAHETLLRDVAGTCRYLGAEPTAASVLYTAVWSYDFAARFAYMEAAALVEASGLSLADFTRSAALRTGQFPEQNHELSDRFAARDFEGDQATVAVYAEGMTPMRGVFSSVGITAHMLDSVAVYAQAAQDAGHGPRDVSVIFDLVRSQALNARRRDG